MKEKIETRVKQCEDCNHTGRCPECRGMGIVDGEKCFCENGRCMVCMGTGKEAEFFYKGRPVPESARSWKAILVSGVALILFGMAGLLVALLAPSMVAHPDGLAELAITIVAGGIAFMVWSLWSRKMCLMEQQAWEEYYEHPPFAS